MMLANQDKNKPVFSNFIVTFVSINDIKFDTELASLYHIDPDILAFTKDTLLRTGQIEDVIVDKNKVVISGHMRVKAMMELQREGKWNGLVRVKMLLGLDVINPEHKLFAKSIAIIDNVARRPLTKEQFFDSIEKIYEIWKELGDTQIILEHKKQLQVTASKLGVTPENVIWVIETYKTYPEFYRFLKSRGWSNKNTIWNFLSLIPEKIRYKLHKEDYDLIADHSDMVRKHKSELKNIDDPEEFMRTIKMILQRKYEEEKANRLNSLTKAREVQRDRLDEIDDTPVVKVEETKNDISSLSDDRIIKAIDVNAVRRYLIKLKEESRDRKILVNREIYEIFHELFEMLGINVEIVP